MKLGTLRICVVFSQLGCFHGNFVITFLWCFQKRGKKKADKANVEDYEWPHILVLRGYFPYPIIYYEYRILCHEYQSDLRLWIPNVHPSLYGKKCLLLFLQKIGNHVVGVKRNWQFTFFHYGFNFQFLICSASSWRIFYFQITNLAFLGQPTFDYLISITTVL